MMSMTGYGRGEARSQDLSVALEVKTVNHRHCEVLVKLPAGLWELETGIQKCVTETVRRGRVEVYVHLLSPVAGTHEPVVDVDLAAKYVRALKTAGTRLKIKGEVDLSLLARLPDVVRVEELPIRGSLAGPLIQKALRQALLRLQDMRKAEGKRLAADIKQRLQTVKIKTRDIQARYQATYGEQETRLQQKLAGWLHADVAEAKRLAQDAVFKHIRADVTEELVRLDSHAGQFAACLRRSEPMGRRLDFLLQEMNREINTVGSKAADAVVAQCVVEVKEELEKIREQVQNLE